MKNIYNKNFSKKFAQTSITNEFLNKPIILRTLGNVLNKKVLEIGCGSGFWLRELAGRGAICTGIDNSVQQIDLAKKLDQSNSITFKVARGEDIPLRNNGIDIVLLCKVLLETGIPHKNEKILREAYRVLKKNGIVLVYDLHPFAPQSHPNCVIPQNYFYFKDGATITFTSRRIDGSKVVFRDKHWSLSALIGFITKAGFLIDSIVEPRATPALARRFEGLKLKMEKPMDIVIRGRKVL